MTTGGVLGMDDFFVWETRYETGVELIDRQHKKLVSIINDLYSGLHSKYKDKSEAFAKAAKDAVDYVRTHFHDEEEWMFETSYPEIESQKEWHRKFIEVLLKKTKEFDEGRTYSAFEFLKFLKEWLISHIAIEDKKFRFHIQGESRDKN
ncbi:MAG: hypothetical protein A2020_05900 [Lentisphaerae bacterium GWF2_45_14]|nr:MAG: hypothetical protein A2020_05900 [Lentisphaerae bacterium GWF2_45_14]